MEMKSNTITIASRDFKFDADLLSAYLEDCIEFDTEMGYSYRIGRGRGKCQEREITFDNCMRYDLRVIKKLEIDYGKKYSTQWILKDGQLYLKSFEAYADNQKVNLNTLFPDLFSSPSPVIAYWVDSRIKINIGYYKNYVCNHVWIEIKQGYISEICHYRHHTERKISEEQLSELIRIISNMSLFESKVHYYIACRLNEYDIVKKLIPVCLYNDVLDSITVRLLDVMRKYPNYFKRLLCSYYPFTREMLKKYQSCLDWYELSGNVFLDWDKELLMNFKDRWDWELIILCISGIKGLENTDMFIKCYEMRLIDAKKILSAIYMMIPYVPNNPIYAEFEEIEELRDEKLKKEKLGIELKKAVIKRKEQKKERLVLLAEDEKPSEELEQIITFLEKKGDVFDERTFSGVNQRCTYHMETFFIPNLSNPLFCDKSLDKGFEYAFNTPEKRKVLDDAVKMFLIEESLRLQIRKIWKMAI